MCGSAVGEKSLLWEEIFGVGLGGFIAPRRPGAESSPAAMSGVIENLCADRGQL